MAGTILQSPKAILARLKLWFQQQQAEKALVDYVVEAVDPKIKMARGYRKRLRKPIQICLAYCKTMVENIPGPIHLNRSDFSADPLIRAVFLGSNIEIGHLIAHQDISLVPADSVEKSRVALLTMAHNETTVFGHKREGDMIVGDARMESVTFFDHKIVGLSTTLEASRDKLEKLCFHIILESVSREMAGKRTDLKELREHRERLQAMSKMFSGKNYVGEFFGHDNRESNAKLEKIEDMLATTEKELDHARLGHDTPEDWLTILVKQLKNPERIMHIEPFKIRLDWSNIIVGSDVENAVALRMARCMMSEDRKREAVLIAYSME